MSAFLEVLRTKLIPWAQHDVDKRFIVARPEMQERQLPLGGRLIRHDLTGKRVVVKKHRAYKNIRNILAEWPDHGLYELGKYALVCVLDGLVDYTLGNYKLRCGSGHFILIPPGIPHPSGSRSYVDLEKSNSCVIVTFLLHPNAVESWMSHGHSQGREQSNCCLILNERVLCLFQAFMEEVVEDEARARQIGKWLLLAFLHVLEREVGAGRLQCIPTEKSQHSFEAAIRSSPADFATRLEQYIQANLAQPLTINRAARSMYLSPAQFTRVVRRETGKSFKEILIDRRLKEAKSLLRNSEWTVAAIAQMVGFQSANYFGAFFKEHVGATPGEFRSRTTTY